MIQKIVEKCDATEVLAFGDARIFCNNFTRWLQKIVATCDVLVFWDATIFCNDFARWLQKIVATCDVLVFGHAMIFCNNFARWLQKIIATQKNQHIIPMQSRHRSMLLSFVSSCKLHAPQTKIFENQKTFRTVALSTFSRVWVLDLGYEPLKSQSKIRISSFVLISKSSFVEHKDDYKR